MRWIFRTLLIALLLLVAACAPEDLDITPSPTATNTPAPTSTPRPTEPATEAAETAEASTTEAAAEAASTGDQGLLQQLVDAVPGRVNAGAIQWNRTRDEVVIQEQERGSTARIAFSEAGGGAAELTWGVFETPEAALAYYESVRGRLRTLENATTRDNFPQPNAFGGGTYGSDAVFAQGNVFIRISVPRFSSTAGDPLVPFARQVFNILESAGVSTGA